MIVRIITFFLIFASGIAIAETHRLNFANGDSLSGSPMLGNEGEITWSSGHFTDAALFDRSSLLHWTKETPATTLPEDHIARLVLNKGGILYGRLADLHADHLVLDTDYIGTITVPRRMIRSLSIVQQQQTLFSGPGKLSDWKSINGPNWAMDNQSFRASQGASIGRILPFPEKRFHLSFKLDWQNSLTFKCKLLASDIESELPQSFYELSVQNNLVSLGKTYEQDNEEVVVELAAPFRPREIQRFQTINLSLYVDLQAGEWLIYIDDTLVKRSTDPSKREGSFGDGLILISGSQLLTFDQILLEAWDGVPPDSMNTASLEPPLTPEQREKDFQSIMLRNGDSIAGKVKAINKNTVTLETEYAAIEIPLERMKTVALRSLKEREYDEAILLPGDVTAHYANGETITFQLKSFDQGKAQAYSQNFGDTEVDLSFFSKVEFNIYSEQYRALR